MAIKLWERRLYQPHELDQGIRDKAKEVSRNYKARLWSRRHVAEIASVLAAAWAFTQMRNPALASQPIPEKLKLGAAFSAAALSPLAFRRIEEKYFTWNAFRNKKRLLKNQADEKEVAEAIKKRTHHAFLDFDGNLHVVPRPFCIAMQAAVRAYRKTLEKVKRKK